MSGRMINQHNISMHPNPTSKAIGSSSNQEIHHILYKPEVHHHVHKSQKLVSIL